MNPYDIGYPRTEEQAIAARTTLVRQVYAWMGAGLLVTALMALVTVSSPTLLRAVVGGSCGSSGVAGNATCPS